MREEMEGLRNLDAGGITPPLTYADHQGSTQARIAEIRGGISVLDDGAIAALLS